MSTIEEAVIKNIRARAKVGKRKYGVTMDRKDLSLVEWLNHAQEEAMDLAVYLEKAIQELRRKEKVCLWRWKPTDTHMRLSCGSHLSAYDPSFNYCPHCGGKIVWKEGTK